MGGRVVLGRRSALRLGLGAALGIVASPLARAAVNSADRRLLAFENLHTGDRLAVPYWADGHYSQEACRQIDWVLRDHRSGDVMAMSRDLLDLLYTVRALVGGKEPFQVISGFRSPKTNAQLVKAGSGVASNSLHTKGLAIDVRLPDCSLVHLRDVAMSLKRGGVGYYPKSNFVHIDVGRIRSW